MTHKIDVLLLVLAINQLNAQNLLL